LETGSSYIPRASLELASLLFLPLGY
jgi:hypothetical protein